MRHTSVMDAESRREVTALRRASHALTASRCANEADLVRGMLALQAQDYPGVLWSIGRRVPGATQASVERALARGDIVRSWPMRGTLHVVAPDNLGWMLAITRRRTATTMARRQAQLELSSHDLGAAAEVARSALHGGGILRRPDLLAAFEVAGISTTGQRGYHLLLHLAVQAVIVFGPVDGKQQTFALFDEWIRESRPLEGDDALAEFARGYFHGHGPATDRDFAWWASLPLSEARTGIAAAGLASRIVGGETYYVDLGVEAASSSDAVHALPGFDEYVLGYHDRSVALPASLSEQVIPGNNGLFRPTIVVDGQVVGTWSRTERATAIEIDLDVSSPLDAPTRELVEREFERYAAFIGKHVAVR
jgi:Winged helix DNA-binding domain